MHTTSLKLYPYQETGVAFLAARKHALLADVMGLGKSPQALLAAKQIQAQSILVICPAIARTNWQREIEKWWPNAQAEITVVSYEGAVKIKRPPIPYDLIIADEAHYLKNPKAKRTQAILSTNGLAHHAKRFWALTGTPIPNHAGELWPLLVTFGVLNTPSNAHTAQYHDFLRYYCLGYDHSFNAYAKPVFVVTGTNPNRIPELKRLLAPISLRRTLESPDVIHDLPSLVINEVNVPPGVVDGNLFDHEAEKLGVGGVANDWPSGLIRPDGSADLDLLKGYAQSLATLRRYNGLQKVAPIVTLIQDELENKAYKKLVIFYQHRQVQQELAKQLSPHAQITTIEGGQTDKTRWQNIDLFQSDQGNQPKIMLAQINAASTAISLNTAHQAIFIEQSWTPGDNQQAIKRLHRHGQKNHVIARVVSLLSDPVDQAVTTTLARKTLEIASVLDENN